MISENDKSVSAGDNTQFANSVVIEATENHESANEKVFKKLQKISLFPG